MDDASRLAALANHVAAGLPSGQIIGLGTGSTATAVIRAIAARLPSGFQLIGVSTSRQTTELATELGISLRDLDDVNHIDIGIDGADEIAPTLDVVKGAGGALLFEKLVALKCRHYQIVAASEKLVTQLGTRMPLPVEIVPLGWRTTAAHIQDLGCTPTLRLSKTGDTSAPFVTDGGHYILDCVTGAITDPRGFAQALKQITGVVDHGLFVNIADRVTIVDPLGNVRTLVRS